MAALGVVYGDIGTSPLYALKEAVKAATANGEPLADAILGIVSLIIWSLVLVVSIKYATLILRADNRGEGGIVAMLALLHARHAQPGTWRAGVLVLGLLGAALLYGDGVITPAISVLSAIEGLKVDAPQLAPIVVPLTLLVLFCLFMVQSKGTSFVGGIFGPIMLAWFVVIGLLGVSGIVAAPHILAAFNPLHAIEFLVHAPKAVAFAVLGATFLAVTGGEAMYADMGHFGASRIRRAWFAVVLPALFLNYLGQGALLLTDPTALSNPFYQLAPDWLHYPLVAFSTVATVIASQAIITGAYSLTQQSMQLGFLPRMDVRHTASEERGQIYVPVVNWLLAAATLGAVVLFGTSDALAGAYGIAVSLLMAITTFLAALVAIQWGFDRRMVLAINGFFLAIDLVFFAANSLKLFEGAWFPLFIAAAIAFLMLTWRGGQFLVENVRAAMRESDDAFFRKLAATPPVRLPGASAFFTSGTVGIPLPLTHHLKHVNALHEHVLLVTVQTLEAPRAEAGRRADVQELASGVSRLILRFGFMEQPLVADGVRVAIEHAGLRCGPPEHISYYIGRETVIPTARIPGMWVWRETVFAFMQRNAERSAAYFGIPTTQVVEIGIEIEI